jgi:hypothetical protein
VGEHTGTTTDPARSTRAVLAAVAATAIALLVAWALVSLMAAGGHHDAATAIEYGLIAA